MQSLMTVLSLPSDENIYRIHTVENKELNRSQTMKNEVVFIRIRKHAHDQNGDGVVSNHVVHREL